jgi:hypothetical protein
LGYLSFVYGFKGVIPVTGDFDGDGRADPTVYDPVGRMWYSLKSTAGNSGTPFGVVNGIPLGKHP